MGVRGVKEKKRERMKTEAEGNRKEKAGTDNRGRNPEVGGRLREETEGDAETLPETNQLQPLPGPPTLPPGLGSQPGRKTRSNRQGRGRKVDHIPEQPVLKN